MRACNFLGARVAAPPSSTTGISRDTSERLANDFRLEKSIPSILTLIIVVNSKT